MWVDRFPLSVPAIFVFKENQNGNNDKKIRTDRNNLTFRLRHRFDTGIEYLIPKRKLRVYLSIFLFTKYLCTLYICICSSAYYIYLQMHRLKSNVCKIIHVIMSLYRVFLFKLLFLNAYNSVIFKDIWHL